MKPTIKHTTHAGPCVVYRIPFISNISSAHILEDEDGSKWILHREDGPAVEYCHNQFKTEERRQYYWYHGKNYSAKDYHALIKTIK